ncbi:hypothetical protein F443_08835 [Plasmopara halstedii]|uniref:Uncharacterized protein n=1 Tax=Plasmopara halstedii TaxID=4781 RepID=A0A0P1AJT8_PLAHL|nr:hypothetical protein F443_08835 [Plasmopara halstedii]CEG41340.1 hypothetical protein F443_08835 [Plasmopara halstedii]|eukprot:XP_024577709.1 hypothetical protein F443_08835 [Plasmopara halstedii]
MTTLWSSSSEAAWQTIWTRYDEVMQSKENDLAALDSWYLASFPPILHARQPEPYVTKLELQQLMKWKLKKGKWRPQLMKYVSGLSAKEVKQASLNAYNKLKCGDLRAATEAFCTLKGVGPATASALLAAYDPTVPFMADEALEAIAAIIGPRKYTLPHFINFAEQLRGKAKWLNEQRAANRSKKVGNTQFWTSQRVQLCLYIEANDKVSPGTTLSTKSAASPAKRKRVQAPTSPRVEKRKTITEERVRNDDQMLRRSQRKANVLKTSGTINQGSHSY